MVSAQLKPPHQVAVAGSAAGHMGRRPGHGEAGKFARGAGAVADGGVSALYFESDQQIGLRDDGGVTEQRSATFVEPSEEQRQAILAGDGNLPFNMSPFIRALVSIVYDYNEGLPRYCEEAAVGIWQQLSALVDQAGDLLERLCLQLATHHARHREAAAT